MHRESIQFHYRKTDLNNMTMTMQELGETDSDRKTKNLSSWREFHKDDTAKYCCYFRVILKNIIREPDFYLFSFQFKSVIHQDLSFRVDKRYSEFTSFVNKLKKKSRARPPSLPQKMLIHEKDMIEKRGRDLSNWLSIVVNERMFHCKDLFQFIGLPEKWTRDYLIIHPLSFLYSENEVNLAITGFENLKGDDNSETFCVFNIKVSLISKTMKNIVAAYEVKRRFREFSNLNAMIKVKFKNYSQPLPELPTKVAFLGKIDAETRQYKLGNYLKLLITYPDIFDVIYFRKFLEIYPSKFTELNVNLFGSQVDFGSDDEDEEEVEMKKVMVSEKSAESGGSQNQ